MNSSDEFTSPIATSTVWKKKKPQGWIQEPDTTFQEVQEQCGAGSINNKENVDTNNKEQSTAVEDVVAGSETTLNLWKYIVPPHPGELEEDSFITDNMVYKLDGSTPNDIEKREFSERIVENLTSLNILAEDFSVTESQRDNPQLLDENFSPIPGYIITENNVIMRRHSSSHDQRVSRKSDDGQSSRKILSAPPSLAILDEPTNTSTDKDLDEEVAALTAKLDKNVDICCLEVEEDLVNESLSKYFELEPDIGSSQDLSGVLKKTELETVHHMGIEVNKSMEPCPESDSPIDHGFLQDCVAPNTDDLQLDCKKSTRESLGSSNTVPYIDPENSMTTEALKTPGCLDETEFDLPAIDENDDNSISHVSVNDDQKSHDGSFHLLDETTQSPDINETEKNETACNGESISLKNSDREFETIGTENVSSEEENCSPKRSYPENTSLETDVIASDENNLSAVRAGIGDVVTAIDCGEVERHPSFSSSPEMKHHHSIIDRILKDDYAPGKEIIIPPTFTLDQPCAVGITKKFPLLIENKTDLWVQCNISVDEVGRMNGFSSQNRLIVPPLAEESLPVCLSAKQDGLCLGNVELTVNSVISGMLPEQYHSCKITAIAELPGLSMLPKQIKFGIQVENKEASYELKNSSDYELPLKVVLHSEGLDEVFSLSDPMSKYPTAVFALVLPPQQSFVGHIEFCPYEQYNVCEASLRVYVDCPNGALLAETDVHGTVGHYKLRIPTEKHSLAFHSSPGEPVSTDIGLINTGNMDTTVTLAVTRPFTVTPPFISSLVPGEEASCQVSYFPVVTEHVTGLLTLSMADDAVVYQVPIEGRSTKNKPKAVPYTLLANKSIVNFGGSEIGRQKEDTILLQNDSPTQLMCLVVRVISPSRSFYILNDTSITLSCDMVLPAGSSQTLKLGYTPLHAEQHVGELLVKSKNKDISFNIPLSGHGGLSQVSVLDAQQTSSRLWVDMGNISPNMRNKARVTLHNTGSRAAFVSGVLEDEEGYTLPSKVAWINPTSFVIPSNSSRELYVIYEAGPAKESAASVNRIALLKLYCGDEIARRRFCSVLKILDRPVQDQDLPFDPSVEYLTPGDMKTEGELKVPHLTQGDMVFERQLFGSGLYQLFISVMGRKGEAARRSLVPLTRQDVSARSRSNTSASNVSAGSLPPDPASGPPPDVAVAKPNAKSSRLSMKKEKEEKTPCWSFSVDELKFSKPSVFHVVNESAESLVYEVSYEGTLYDVTPRAGCIPPCGCTEISIRPRVSTSPFISTLLVSAGGTERTLKLSFTPTQSERPSSQDRVVLSHCPSDVLGDTSKPLKVVDKVSFQTIPLNTSCSAFLEFTNTHRGVLQWRLTSVAPAYRKVENSDPIRVPYSVFCVEIVSGMTPSGSQERIPVTFFPKHVGNFTQCWTLTYFRDALRSLKHTHRVILEGSATTSSARSASVLSSHSSSTSHRPKDRVFIRIKHLDFATPLNSCQSLSFKLGNPLKTASKVKLSTLLPPFYLKYKEVLVEAGHSARIPVKYKPTTFGEFREFLQIDTDHGVLTVELKGKVTGPEVSDNKALR